MYFKITNLIRYQYEVTSETTNTATAAVIIKSPTTSSTFIFIFVLVFKLKKIFYLNFFSIHKKKFKKINENTSYTPFLSKIIN